MKLIIAMAMTLWSSAIMAQDSEPRGTVVGPEYCGDPNSEERQRRGRSDTLYTRVSDGNGGTWRQTVESNSPQCGPPARRTVVGPEYCGSPNTSNRERRGLQGTLYTRVADGNGGTWRQTLEVDAEVCESAIVVDIVEREGDWFKPVVIEVTGPAEWDFEIEAGHAKRTDTGIEITSDGQVGVWYATISGVPYEYELVEPPLCLSSYTDNKYKIDCEGEWIGANAAPMIWYDETDTQVVDVEIGVFRSNQYCDERDEFGAVQTEKCAHGVRAYEGSNTRTSVETAIANMNEFNRRSGVYIRFVLVDVVWNDGWNDIYGFSPARNSMGGIDLSIGWGPAGEYYAGQAYMSLSFYEGKRPTAGVTTGFSGSARQGTVALHELGHMMGLGHGVWNNPNWVFDSGDPLPNGGSIFPQFGHGWAGIDHQGLAVCDRTSTVMSYQSSFLWSNSLYSCALDHDRDGGWWGDAAGSRDQSDEAYALNRVRYSLSLVHNEHRNNELAPLPRYDRPNDEPEILISD